MAGVSADYRALLSIVFVDDRRDCGHFSLMSARRIRRARRARSGKAARNVTPGVLAAAGRRGKLAAGNIGALLAVAGLSVLSVLGGTPASASPASAARLSAAPATRPHGCATAYFRSACAAPITNHTTGFDGPGQTSRSAGFPFTFVEWNKQGWGYDAAHSEVIRPDGTGFAYSRNTGGYLTGVQGTYVYEVGSVLKDQRNGTIRI